MSQRRPTVRPRPLDPFKQLQVIRDGSQFDAINEDDDATNANSNSSNTASATSGAADAGIKAEKDGSSAGSRKETPVQGEAPAEKSASSSSSSPPSGKGAEKGNDKNDKDNKEGAVNDDSKKNETPAQHTLLGTLTEQLAEKGQSKSHQTKFNLPVPESQRVSTFDQTVPSTFKPNNAYVRYRPKHIDDHNFSGETEYELSVEDEQWLRQHPKYNPKGPYPLSEENFERMIDLMERRTGREFPINLDIATQLVKKIMNLDLRSKENTVVHDVYAWWFQKRQKLRKPLLRRFWPATAADDSSPNLTFRPLEKERYRLRKKRQNNTDSYEKMLQLKSDFEMMRCVLELVRRREHLREIEADLLEDEFNQKLDDIIYGPGLAPARKPLAPSEIKVGVLAPEEYEATFDIYPQPSPMAAAMAARGTSTPTPSVMERAGSEVASIDTGMGDADQSKKKKKSKKSSKKRALEEAALVAAPAVPGAPAPVPGISGTITPVDPAAPPPKKKKKKKSSTIPPAAPVPGGPVPAAVVPSAPVFIPGAPAPVTPLVPEIVSGVGVPAVPGTASAPTPSTADPASMLPPKPKKPTKPPLFLRSIENFAHYASEDFELMPPVVPSWPPPNYTMHELQRRQALQSQAEPSLAPTVENEFPRKLYYQNIAPPFNSQVAAFKDRQRYRCRGRIGRGGRIIMDRIPVAQTQAGLGNTGTQTFYQARKQKIRDEYVGHSPLESGQDFLDPSKPRSSYGLGLDQNAKPVTLTAHSRTKLQAIYAREDSEDEEVEMIEYPYVSAPLRPDPEEAARLTAMATKDRIQTIREAKFRFLIQ